MPGLLHTLACAYGPEPSARLMSQADSAGAASLRGRRCVPSYTEQRAALPLQQIGSGWSKHINHAPNHVADLLGRYP